MEIYIESNEHSGSGKVPLRQKSPKIGKPASIGILHKPLFRHLFFLRKPDTHLNSVNKSCPFMIPAEGADGIDNPVHFPQGHSVQQAVQLTEIRFDLVIVYTVCIAISLIEQRHDRFAISQIQLAGRYIGFKCLDIFRHVNTKISSSRMISSALAQILFMRCTHAIGSLAFNGSVIPSAAFI